MSTDSRTDRQTDRQTDRETDRQGRYNAIIDDLHLDKVAGIQRDKCRQTDRHGDRQIHKAAIFKQGRQTDPRTDRRFDVGKVAELLSSTLVNTAPCE